MGKNNFNDFGFLIKLWRPKTSGESFVWRKEITISSEPYMLWKYPSGMKENQDVLKGEKTKRLFSQQTNLRKWESMFST